MTMIIKQCFPLVIERYERDPVSPEASIGSLERYRKMGYDAIRNLPQEEKQRDQSAIDTAFQESAEKIQRLDEQRRQHCADTHNADDLPVQS
ncbi:MAG TPA: hypothetical protein PKH71_00600 [Methanoregulaceae archaeon]|nr:hypothetical protein [Methanoregulaceae archaeon]HNL85632.1 hypothetical protein [Methanoregulaceae archaeon]